MFPFTIPEDANPRWSSELMDQVDLDVCFPHLESPENPTGRVPYTASIHSLFPHEIQIYQAAAKLSPGAFVPTPPVLMPLTARQFRLALLSLGVTRQMVETAIDGIADQTAKAQAEIEWEYASTYQRTHALVQQFATHFGLTDAAVDAAWAAFQDV